MIKIQPDIERAKSMINLLKERKEIMYLFSSFLLSSIKDMAGFHFP